MVAHLSVVFESKMMLAVLLAEKYCQKTLALRQDQDPVVDIQVLSK